VKKNTCLIQHKELEKPSLDQKAQWLLSVQTLELHNEKERLQ
jgi:hypothetical protein